MGFPIYGTGYRDCRVPERYRLAKQNRFNELTSDFFGTVPAAKRHPRGKV